MLEPVLLHLLRLNSFRLRTICFLRAFEILTAVLDLIHEKLLELLDLLLRKNKFRTHHFNSLFNHLLRGHFFKSLRPSRLSGVSLLLVARLGRCADHYPEGCNDK